MLRMRFLIFLSSRLCVVNHSWRYCREKLVGGLLRFQVRLLRVSNGLWEKVGSSQCFRGVPRMRCARLQDF